MMEQRVGWDEARRGEAIGRRGLGVRVGLLLGGWYDVRREAGKVGRKERQEEGSAPPGSPRAPARIRRGAHRVDLQVVQPRRREQALPDHLHLLEPLPARATTLHPLIAMDWVSTVALRFFPPKEERASVHLRIPLRPLRVRVYFLGKCRAIGLVDEGDAMSCPRTGAFDRHHDVLHTLERASCEERVCRAEACGRSQVGDVGEDSAPKLYSNVELS